MISDRDVYIIDCVRTPIGRGRADGLLHNIHPVDLLTVTLKELMIRAKVDKIHVEDVIGGIVSPVAEQGANVPRLAALKAGFPISVPGVQLNRMCGSGQQAVHFASQAIASGDMDCVIACGVEMMGVVQMGSDSNLMGEGRNSAFAKEFPFKILHQGQSADLICEKFNITREEMDKFAGASHEKAAAATKKGYFKREILPLKVKKGDKEILMQFDEGIRVPVDYEKLKQLPPVFNKNGRITAAHASQISDGAAAILLCSGRKLKELGVSPKARIVARTVVGSDPVLMLTGPIHATSKVLEKANLKIENIDCVEINEAFACVVIAWMKEIQPKPEIVNPNGGAIAHGHPLGATGAILMTKLVHELARTNGKYGLQTMCIGFGQATATIIENCAPLKAKL